MSTDASVSAATSCSLVVEDDHAAVGGGVEELLVRSAISADRALRDVLNHTVIGPRRRNRGHQRACQHGHGSQGPYRVSPRRLPKVRGAISGALDHHSADL